MSHDLLAELAGYNNELAGYGRNKERAEQVRAQIERVTAQIRVRVEQLQADADNHITDGQDVLAAQALVEARRLVRESDIKPVETVVDAAPRETVTPPAKKKGA